MRRLERVSFIQQILQKWNSRNSIVSTSTCVTYKGPSGNTVYLTLCSTAIRHVNHSVLASLSTIYGPQYDLSTSGFYKHYHGGIIHSPAANTFAPYCRDKLRVSGLLRVLPRTETRSAPWCGHFAGINITGSSAFHNNDNSSNTKSHQPVLGPSTLRKYNLSRDQGPQLAAPAFGEELGGGETWNVRVERTSTAV